MKSMMGFGFFLLFLAGIAFVMLQGRQMAGQHLPGGGASMTGVTWRPSVLGADSVPEDSGMSVMFSVDGSISGHAGCNSFSGSMESTDDGVGIGHLAATRMACPEAVMSRENAFLAALQSAKHFEMGAKRLQLLDEDKKLIAELVTEK